jgi:hypothetical protein
MYSVKNTDGRKPAKILHTLLIMHTILNMEKASRLSSTASPDISTKAHPTIPFQSILNWCHSPIKCPDQM